MKRRTFLGLALVIASVGASAEARSSAPLPLRDPVEPPGKPVERLCDPVAPDYRGSVQWVPIIALEDGSYEDAIKKLEAAMYLQILLPRHLIGGSKDTGFPPASPFRPCFREVIHATNS